MVHCRSVFARGPNLSRGVCPGPTDDKMLLARQEKDRGDREWKMLAFLPLGFVLGRLLQFGHSGPLQPWY